METRKDIKQEDIQPGSEYLRFQRDILRVLNVYTMKRITVVSPTGRFAYGLFAYG